MRRYLKSVLQVGVVMAGLMSAFAFLSDARAQAVVRGGNPYYYNSAPYYPATVVNQPLLLPRTGSNDYLYQYDNVYGAGASAAGRMDRVVNNPQPQLWYPRQPRVYIGY